MRLGSPVILSYLAAGFEPRCGRKDFLCACLLLLLAAACCLLLLKRVAHPWPLKGGVKPRQGKPSSVTKTRTQQQAAASSNSRSKSASDHTVAQTGIQVARNDREANTHHHNQIWLHFEPSSPFYGRFRFQKWPFVGHFQDDRPENSGRSLVYRVGVSNEGRCSSIAIGPSKECKWVENKACAMPWCHGVGYFEVKRSLF